MPISVTCQCGSKLEIDEKFLGKEIPCPDCHRPLPTRAPAAAPPPLELPDYKRTSGLAVLSLTLALVGMFTIVGTIAAIVVGVFALKEIADSKRLGGLGLARAGIVVGAVGTFLTLAMFISPTVLGIDQLLRELAYAGRIQYSTNPHAVTTHTQKANIKLERPARNWATLISRTNSPKNFDIDDLIILNIREDAFIACQWIALDDPATDEEDLLKKVLARFHRSELVNVLGRLNDTPLGREGVIVEQKIVKVLDSKKEVDRKQVTLDLRLAGVDRRFLIQFAPKEFATPVILVGAARRNDFERKRPTFDKNIASKEDEQ
ncbi:MAG: DUF4190 domain-containing protein [Planctomycetes bacterium]|nr:DUF4190 domain-containing protein [Planctomycetota bacterium]